MAQLDEPLVQPIIDSRQKNSELPEEKFFYFYQNYHDPNIHSLASSTNKADFRSDLALQISKDPQRSFELQSYKYSFDFGLFLRILLAQIMLLFLGPIVMILNLIFQRNVINNAIPLNQFDKYGFVAYVLVPIIILYEILSGSYGHLQFLTSFETIIFLTILQAFHVAHATGQFSDWFRSVRLDADSIRYSPLYLYYMGEKERKIKLNESLEEEGDNSSDVTELVRQTSLALNIDFSILHYKHLQGTKIGKLDMIPTTELPFEFTKHNIVTKSTAPSSSLMYEYVEAEKAFFAHKYLEGESRLDKDKSYGDTYELALNLAKNCGDMNYYSFLLFVLLYPLLPSAFDATNKSTTWYGILGWYFLCLIPIVFLGLIIFQGLSEIQTTNTLMKILSKKIALERQTAHNIDKLEPTFDIFDYATLRSWAALRKIFIHLYDRDIRTMSLSISLVISFQAIGMLVIIFLYLGVIQPDGHNHTHFYVVFGLESSIYLVLLLLLTLKGAELNGYFSSHRELLRANKDVVVTVGRLYPTLIGNDPVVPATYIYAEGFKRLYREFREDYSPEVMSQKIDMLANTYDSMIEDLEYEEEFRPFRLLGITANNGFITAQVIALVALVVAVIPNLVEVLKKAIHSN